MKKLLLLSFLFGCGADIFVDPPDTAPDSDPTDDGGIEASPFDGCLPAKEVCYDAGSTPDASDASDAGTQDAVATLIQTSCNRANPSGIFCGNIDCVGDVAKYADAYCQLAGFSKAESYQILDSGAVYCLWFDAGLQAPSNCNEVHYGAGQITLSDACEAIQNLECQ